MEVKKEEMLLGFDREDGGDQHAVKKQLLESARAEIGEMKEENERLKSVLSRIRQDYESLKRQLSIAIGKGQLHLQEEITTPEEKEEAAFLSLSLATGKETKPTSACCRNGHSKSNGIPEGDLSLALLRSSPSRDRSSSGTVKDDDDKEEEEEEKAGAAACVLGKNPRTDVHDLSSLVHVKKARVSVRVRCETPTMNDGCQWRKYGQKISKGNPCPRAYYRCTVAPACPVRKQVQRCAEDMSILITTYEGTHNHALSLAAATVASTTSAAASMLLSPSATSRPGFTLSQAAKPTLFLERVGGSPSHPPLITLDLTSSNPQINTNALGVSAYPSLASGYFNKYTGQLDGSRGRNPGLATYLPSSSGGQPQEALTETLARAIATDPNFKSALAVAIASIVEGEGTTQATTSTSMPVGATYEHLNKALAQSSSSLGFLNGKSSSTMESRNVFDP